MDKKIQIHTYKSAAKNYAIEELLKIAEMNETDFLFQLAGLYGRTLAKTYKIK